MARLGKNKTDSPGNRSFPGGRDGGIGHFYEGGHYASHTPGYFYNYLLREEEKEHT